MKRLLFLLALTVLLFSCGKEEFAYPESNIPEANLPEEEAATDSVRHGAPVRFAVTVNPETRSTKTEWEDADQIFIFFKSWMAEGKDAYLRLTYNKDEEEWSSSDPTMGKEWEDPIEWTIEMPWSGTAHVFHFPGHFTYVGDFDSESRSYPFLSSYDDWPTVYYLYKKDVPFKFVWDNERNEYVFSISATLQRPDDVAYFFIPGVSVRDSDYYTFSSYHLRPLVCSSMDADGNITEDLTRYNQRGGRIRGVAENGGILFAARLAFPGTEKDYSFMLANNDKIYKLFRNGRALVGGKQYNFPELSNTGENGWIAHNHSDLYVDMGLPSGIKWGQYNVGITSTNPRGDLFAWGQNYPDDNLNYTIESYIYSNWTVYYPQTTQYWVIYKYNSGSVRAMESNQGDSGVLDYKTVLDDCDDVARNRCGGKWHMPSYAQVKELIDYTTAEPYTLDGVTGARFISTVNGNWIFFPYAGFRTTSLLGWGQMANCWMSDMTDMGTDTGGKVPGYLNIASGYYYDAGFGRWIDGLRAHDDSPWIGRSIRPIWVP